MKKTKNVPLRRSGASGVAPSAITAAFSAAMMSAITAAVLSNARGAFAQALPLPAAPAEAAVPAVPTAPTPPDGLFHFGQGYLRIRIAGIYFRKGAGDDASLLITITTQNKKPLQYKFAVRGQDNTVYSDYANAYVLPFTALNVKSPLEIDTEFLAKKAVSRSTSFLGKTQSLLTTATGLMTGGALSTISTLSRYASATTDSTRQIEADTTVSDLNKTVISDDAMLNAMKVPTGVVAVFTGGRGRFEATDAAGKTHYSLRESAILGWDEEDGSGAIGGDGRKGIAVDRPTPYRFYVDPQAVWSDKVPERAAALRTPPSRGKQTNWMPGGDPAAEGIVSHTVPSGAYATVWPDDRSSFVLFQIEPYVPYPDLKTHPESVAGTSDHFKALSDILVRYPVSDRSDKTVQMRQDAITAEGSKLAATVESLTETGDLSIADAQALVDTFALRACGISATGAESPQDTGYDPHALLTLSGAFGQDSSPEAALMQKRQVVAVAATSPRTPPGGSSGGNAAGNNSSGSAELDPGAGQAQAARTGKAGGNSGNMGNGGGGGQGQSSAPATSGGYIIRVAPGSGEITIAPATPQSSSVADTGNSSPSAGPDPSNPVGISGNKPRGATKGTGAKASPAKGGNGGNRTGASAGQNSSGSGSSDIPATDTRDAAVDPTTSSANSSARPSGGTAGGAKGGNAGMHSGTNSSPSSAGPAAPAIVSGSPVRTTHAAHTPGAGGAQRKPVPLSGDHSGSIAATQQNAIRAPHTTLWLGHRRTPKRPVAAPNPAASTPGSGAPAATSPPAATVTPASASPTGTAPPSPSKGKGGGKSHNPVATPTPTT